MTQPKYQTLLYMLSCAINWQETLVDSCKGMEPDYAHAKENLDRFNTLYKDISRKQPSWVK